MTIFLSLCFLLLAAASAVRIYAHHQTPGPFDATRSGYCDFQNGLYFPSLAFLHRDSPYSPSYVDEYPVDRTIPFFSPVILALHAPWALLPLHVAECAYFVWSLGMVVAIAFVISHWLMSERCAATDSEKPRWSTSGLWCLTMFLSCCLIASRGGQQTVFTGYFTFELILATLVAVHYGSSRPRLSALALLLVSAKPTMVVPIGILMLCRGNLKALAVGGCISLIGAIACIIWIAPPTGLVGFAEEVNLAQEFHQAEFNELPVNTWVRVDLLAIFAKWTHWQPSQLTHLLVMAVILTPVGLLLGWYHYRVQDSGSVLGLSGGIVLLLPVIAIYHHVYDAIIVAPTVIAAWLSSSRPWNSISTPERWVIAVCGCFPAANFLSSQSALQKLSVEGGTAFQIITSLNAVALAVASVILLRNTFKVAWFQPSRATDSIHEPYARGQ